METKYHSIAEAVMLLGLVFFGGVIIDEENIDSAFKCKDSGIAMTCDSLGKYYGLENGKCYNAELGNKLCKTGWEPFSEIVQETRIVNSGEDYPLNDFTTSPDGKTCYIKGDLRRGVSCDSI